MSIAAVAYVSQAPSTDSTSSSRYDDSSSADAFAGILSTAMNASQASINKPASKPEGTSELDAKDDADDRGDADSTDSTPDANNATPNAAKAPLNPAPNEIVRSISALDPQLQAKLARVMQRMRDETGHDVTVTETYRSQSRQNALFAQGRTATGPVVTWTQSSKHSQGRAVDVELDSGNAPKSAYTALQRIANEEGLGTLGARDPGHLELRGTTAKAGNTASINPAPPADATGEGQMPVARLATVARVADVQVATPAPVARVAQVAQPGQPGIAALARAAAKHGGQSGDSQRGSQGSQGDARGYASLVTMRVHDDPASSVFPTAAVTATPSDAVARAEKVMSVMDSSPARPLSQITMNVDAGNGMTDRVHVAMRGSSVSAAIDTGDARVAQLLNDRADELSRALGRDGIELRELRARAATDTGTVTAAANAQSSQSSADASTNSRFDRGETNQRQQEQQDRQRGQQRGRQQQRQQRGERQ